MNRLTNKDCWKYEDFVFSYRNRETMQSGIDFAMYVKLKSLEDLEEEIGVDFITLVKILKDGVYINNGGIVGEIGNIYKEQVKSIEHWPVWGFTAGDDDEMKTLCAFKDRGKTWALSKEEFYKNIK